MKFVIYDTLKFLFIPTFFILKICLAKLNFSMRIISVPGFF